MERRFLESLPREELVEHARSAGVLRPDVLTRTELIEALLQVLPPGEPQRGKLQALISRARNVVAVLVEKGLHLPEAAERIRSPLASDPGDPAPPALATVTLAEIYAAQGHVSKALHVLETVLAAEPHHTVAQSLYTRLKQQAVTTDVPPLASAASSDVHATTGSPKSEVASTGPGPVAMLDDAPLPECYDVDEAVVMPVDPNTAYVYWEVRRSTWDSLHAHHPHVHVMVRLFVVSSSEDMFSSTTRDVSVESLLGDTFVHGLPPGASLRVALGWHDGAQFHTLTMSPSYTSPPSGPAPWMAERLVHWSMLGILPVSPRYPSQVYDLFRRGWSENDDAAFSAPTFGPNTFVHWRKLEGTPGGSSEQWIAESFPLPSLPGSDFRVSSEQRAQWWRRDPS